MTRPKVATVIMRRFPLVVGLFAAMIAPPPAFAGLGGSIVPDFGNDPVLVVGSEGLPATVFMANNSTFGDVNRLVVAHEIRLWPSCGSATIPCPPLSADLGVFRVGGLPPASVGVATGTGSAPGCAGTWTIEPGSSFAETGEMLLLPPAKYCIDGDNDGQPCESDLECTGAPVALTRSLVEERGLCRNAFLLGPQANAGTNNCLVSFDIDVLSEVTKDAAPGASGAQTRILAAYNVHFAGEPLGDTPQTGNDLVTVALPTPTPTNTPTDTPTETPTETPTFTPTETPTDTPTFTPTETPTDTPTETPTFTPTDTPTETPTFTPTDTPTETPTFTPTETPTDTPTETPTFTPTETPTDTPTPTPTPTPVCGDGIVEGEEVCDDPECCPTCQSPVEDGTSCSSNGTFCDGVESCVSGICASPGDPCVEGGECQNLCDEEGDSCLSPVGTGCTDDGNACTADACDGDGNCAHSPGNAGVTCRTADGLCDVEEVCDGSSSDCPEDVFAEPGVVCRADASSQTLQVLNGGGEGSSCDIEEVCTGSSRDCPDDVVVAAGTPCRSAVSICDVADVCDGSSAFCLDGFAPSSTVCRPGDGSIGCDPEETCTGSGADCPADALNPGGVACNDGDGSTWNDQCGGSVAEPNGQCSGTVTAQDYILLRWPEAVSPAEVDLRVGFNSFVTGTTCASTVRFGTNVRQSSPPSDGQSFTVGLNSGSTVVRLGRRATHAGGLVTGGGGASSVVLGRTALVAGSFSTDGSSEQLARCEAAGLRARKLYDEGFAEMEGADPATIYLTNPEWNPVRARRRVSVSFGPGRHVITVADLVVGGLSTLTLRGTPTTSLVFRVTDDLLLRVNSQLVLDGISPERVLFLVGDEARIGGKADFAGTIISGRLVRVGGQALVVGQVASARLMSVGAKALLNLAPYSGWLTPPE